MERFPIMVLLEYQHAGALGVVRIVFHRLGRMDAVDYVSD
jgi:hypothetical protein